MATVVTVATRNIMASRPNPAVGDIVFLTESGREGEFQCLAGTAPADVRQGLFVPSNTAGFYYARIWDKVHGRPEWFGAITGNDTVDNRAAFDACVALCPTILFSAADYYIQDVWKMGTSSRHLLGVAGSGSTVGVGVDKDNPMGLAGGTRIILSGNKVNDGTIMQFGKDFSATDDIDQMRHSSMKDIVFARRCTTSLKPRPSLNADPINCVKGVLLCYFSDCIVENVASFDSPVGFHIFGVVISELVNLKARRVTPATSATNDFWVGYLVGGYGAANFGYIGSNASVYLRQCKVFDQDPQFDVSTGIRMFGRFADTFLIDFEMARMDYGIEIDGRGSNGLKMPNGFSGGIDYKYAHQDVSIVNPVLDGYGSGGINVHDTHDWFCLDIVNLYAAGGGYGLRLQDSAGSVTVTGGRMLSGGVKVGNVNGVAIQGLKTRDAPLALYMNNCGMFNIAMESFMLDTAADIAGNMVLDHCFRGRLEASIRGAPGLVTYGVNVRTPTNNLITVDGTSIDPGCFVAVTPANKVRYNGVDARTGFGTNLLTGTTA